MKQFFRNGVFVSLAAMLFWAVDWAAAESLFLPDQGFFKLLSEGSSAVKEGAQKGRPETYSITFGTRG